MHAKEKSSKKRDLGSTVLSIGVLLLFCGGVILVNRYLKTHGTVALPSPDQTVTSAQGEPEESKPDQSTIDEYSVPADQPRSIRINSVEVYGLIQKIGITDDNAMAVPSNIHFAGWYTGSVKPGEKGLSIINGHVLGRYTDAIFKQLVNVKVGDEIEIEFGDKSVKKFIAVEIITVAADKASSRLFTPKKGIKAQLNLITCGGKYDASSKSYADRVIVVAKLAN